jgi:glyoxylate utilization-related uncharacterized protein
MAHSDLVVGQSKLKTPGEKFSTEVAEEGEQMLFVWKGGLSVKSQQATYEVGERETIFISGRNNLEVQNNSSDQAVVIQVQAPPHSGWK